ncbi:hypothetical protein BDZ94DRAFT_1249550 [Collybia nuda]|uniref:Uncharacterized protein n=1 Tax=Collybia nuda TaxID=64659 RepID=A0A9P6CNW6_9AGAR|nr:hypothetical protein BDZ94DRAFT_1249550 [Collybia nuda]
MDYKKYEEYHNIMKYMGTGYSKRQRDLITQREETRGLKDTSEQSRKRAKGTLKKFQQIAKSRNHIPPSRIAQILLLEDAFRVPPTGIPVMKAISPPIPVTNKEVRTEVNGEGQTPLKQENLDFDFPLPLDMVPTTSTRREVRKRRREESEYFVAPSRPQKRTNVRGVDGGDNMASSSRLS